MNFDKFVADTNQRAKASEEERMKVESKRDAALRDLAELRAQMAAADEEILKRCREV